MRPEGGFMARLLNAAVVAVALCLVPADLVLADHKDKYHGGALDAREHGYEHGYRDGLHHGVNDRDHRSKYKPEVKDADAGYEKYMGNKDQYKDGYRAGFNAGYDDGFYNRSARLGEIYGPYDNSYRARGSADRYDDVYAERRWGGSDVAFDMGYRDGLAAGADDYRSRAARRPEDSRDFQYADHGYRPSYGDKALYQRDYRDGFIQGYRDGYSGTR
jgi:hypothetical protein